MNSTSSLPPLYARWIEQLIGDYVPEQTEATCHDCPMCSRDEARNKSGFIFNERTKCCTYMPDLANYLVGLIYREADPAFAGGKAAFLGQVKRGLVVTPLGMFPPPAFIQFYKRNKGSFGHDIRLLCPYFLDQGGGLCGIWKFRNARCASWFCKFNRGSFDVVFWKYIDQLLTAVEKCISRWCVLELDIGPSAMQRLFPPPPTERTMNDIPWSWGSWLGRESEFFERCADLVESLNWNDIQSIGGTEIRLNERLVLDAFRATQYRHLPARLKLGKWKRTALLNGDVMRIWAYNDYDPIDVPKMVADALATFQNRETHAALEILRKQGIVIDESLLRKLVDFAVLVAV